MYAALGATKKEIYITDLDILLDNACIHFLFFE